MSYLVKLFRATEEENRRVILTLLDRQPAARLLDLGCYDGEWTMRLAQQIGTQQITGVEVVPEMAAKSRAKGIHVVEASLNQPLPLPNASFDVIHANQVIEHLYDTDRFVVEISRLLAPRGYAVISTNNLSSLHNIVSLVLGQQPPPCHVSNKVLVGNRVSPMEGESHEAAAMAHLRIFSYRALRAFLRYYGLKTEKYRTVGFYPFPVTLGRVLTSLFPIYGAFLTCKVRHAIDNQSA